MRPAGATKHRANSCHQFPETERLDDVVVGAEFQQHDPIDLVAAGGDHDDGHVARITQLLAHHTPFEVGQTEVEQYQVDWWRLERCGAGGGQFDLEPLAPKTLEQRIGNRRVVLDQQQSHPSGSRTGDPRLGIAYPTFALVLPPAGAAIRTVVHMTSTPSVDPTERTRSARSLTSRTSLVTAAAIAGVLVAGTAAVAANIGILNAADSSAIGDLAATDELLPAPGADVDTPTVTVTSVEAPETTAATTTVPTSAAQQYDIAETGSVWVLATRSGIALDHVVVEEGWTSALSQSDPRLLRVDFSDAGRTIVFTAELGDDGAVLVDVTEPTTVVGETPVAAPAATASQDGTGSTPITDTYDDDHDEHDEHDDDEDDDDQRRRSRRR